MRTRRVWKKTFRYVRVYLPLVLLLLAAMVVFLPISGSWLTRKARQEAADRLGVDLKLEQLEIVIAEARVQARGVTLEAASPGAPPFRLERVVAEGELRGLLAGDDRWPARITIDSPSPIRYRRDGEEYYHLTGPIQAVIDAVGTAMEHSAQSGKPAAPRRKPRPSSGRTPEIVLRNLEFEIEEPRADLPPISIRIDECRIGERPSASAPWHAELRGVATATSPEKFALTLDYLPGQRRLSLEGDLSGLMVPFPIPPLGEFTGRVRNLRLDFDGEQDAAGNWSGALTVDAGQFDVRRDSIGGEHWSDTALEIRVRADFSPSTSLLSVRELSLNGDQIGVFSRGEVHLRRGFDGRAELSVQRLPAAALALGRSELLRKQGIEVTPMDTSPTLRLEARVEGLLAGNPADLDSKLSLHLGGWRLDREGKLPEPVELENLDLEVSRDRLTMNDLSLRFGELVLSAHGDVPVSDPASISPGRVIVDASGPSDAAFDLLSRLRAVPSEITSFNAPVRFDAIISVAAVREPGKLAIEPRIIAEETEATLSWKEGSLGLRRVLDPLKLEAGLLRYAGGRVDVERLGVAVNSLSFSASGSVSGGPLPGSVAGPLAYKGRVTAGGNLSDLLFYLGHEVRLPALPPDLEGQFQMELFATGTPARPSEPDYEARLFLTDLRGSIPTRWRQVVVKDLDAELRATPLKLEVPMLKVVLADDKFGDSTADLKFVLDETHARAEASARTTLEYVASVLAKDLSDLQVAGVLPAVGWGEATLRQPLPPGPDVVRRWIAAVRQPDFRVGVGPDADLRVDYLVTYRPESPLEVTPREFPVRIENVRGNATFDPKGIHLTAIRADLGSAKDVQIEGLVELKQPTSITFDLTATKLDLNEWLGGWGQQPWASKPVSYTPRWTLNPNSQQFVEINGRIRAKELRFLQFSGQEVEGDLEFEAWSRRAVPSQLWVRNIRAKVYQGETDATLEFGFPPGQRPILHAEADLRRIDLQMFMDDLLERRQAMDGNLDGNLTFDGQLLNYPTYTGRGRYLVTESSFVGRVIFEYASNLLQMTSRTGGRDTTIRGTVSMADQKVFMPDLELVSPAVNITADGHVDFRGRLFYDLTASVISKQLKNIPIVGIVGNIWDVLGKEVVSYELRGNIRKPENRTVPTLVKHVTKITALFRESREKFAAKSGQQ